MDANTNKTLVDAIIIEACKDNPDFEDRVPFVQRFMFRALDCALKMGVVVTIEQKSVPPLAMGNYEHVISCRPARK